MDNDIVTNIANRLEQSYGWNHHCAQSFATFLSVTNENSTDCLPENHPYWCDFIIAVHTLEKSRRPMHSQILDILVKEMGWSYPVGEDAESSAYYLSMEYEKCLILLDCYAEAIQKGYIRIEL